MANSKQIVYLSQAQYAELIANGSITVDGVTVTYDENDIYVTPQAEPVTDVRVAGTSVAANGVADIPVANTFRYGVVRTDADYGTQNLNDRIAIQRAADDQCKIGVQQYRPIVTCNQHLAAFYGLAKAAGHDEKDSTEPLGTYTPEAKGAIQKMLGVSDLIATEENNLIASKAYSIGEVFTANGKLYKATAAIAADGAIITDGASANCEETSVGEGFPHDIQINGESIVNEGVANIPFANANNGGGIFRFRRGRGLVMSGDGYMATNVTDVQINGTTIIDGSGVANIPIATQTNFGVTKGYGSSGINIDASGNVSLAVADTTKVKAGTSNGSAIPPSMQHAATFYGLAKAAGADEKDSTLPVGQYTDTAKSAIRIMLGAVGDVQIAGNSITTNEVANIPIATGSKLGVAQGYNSRGIGIDGSGRIFTMSANIADIKGGANTYNVVTPSNQHQSIFYGLAIAAGDTTQKASDNVVGQYTDSAKASIKAMLGIQDGSTGTVEVTDTTPTITAVENTRYVCGEVTSLSFTPPASGISIVRFTSGSTVTVLTIPSTVKFPEWFDPTSLETNTIYEICVTDGEFGAVMSWAL